MREDYCRKLLEGDASTLERLLIERVYCSARSQLFLFLRGSQVFCGFSGGRLGLLPIAHTAKLHTT
jgi:hypothetical protein